MPLYRLRSPDHCDVSEGLYVGISHPTRGPFPGSDQSIRGLHEGKPPFVPRRAVDAAYRAVKLRCGGFVFRKAEPRDEFRLTFVIGSLHRSQSFRTCL